jgi:hypothetical protein
VRIIRDCLHQNPVKISKKLHLLFTHHGLILTAEEARLRLFAESPPWQLPEPRPAWISLTIHVLQASMLLDPRLAIFRYEFLNVPKSVSLDIVRTSIPGLSVRQFQLNRRLLDFNYVHQGRELCLAFEHFQENGEADEDHIICDCAAEKLFHIILSEVESISNDEKELLRLLQRDLLKTMPRYLDLLSIENDTGEIESTLTWDTLKSKHHGKGFVVALFGKDYGEVHSKHLLYCQRTAEEREPLRRSRSSNDDEREHGDQIWMKEKDGEKTFNLPQKTFDVCSLCWLIN